MSLVSHTLSRAFTLSPGKQRLGLGAGLRHGGASRGRPIMVTEVNGLHIRWNVASQVQSGHRAMRLQDP